MSGKIISFVLEDKYRIPLKDYCSESYNDSVSLFVRKATIDRMIEFGIISEDIKND